MKNLFLISILFALTLSAYPARAQEPQPPEALSVEAPSAACGWEYYSSGKGNPLFLANDPTGTSFDFLQFGDSYKQTGASSAANGYLDFDGDGKTDVFRTYLRLDGFYQWQYFPGAGSNWVDLAYASPPPQNLRFGDFDGDRKTDVFAALYDSQFNVYHWKYSPAGVGNFIPLASSINNVDTIRFGDFNGDDKTDVFINISRQDGLFDWYYYSGGQGNPLSLNAFSDISLQDLRFGDFDFDGKTDVFAAIPKTDGTYDWSFSSGGSASFQLLRNSSLPVSELRFGAFDGNGKTDVFTEAALPNGGRQWYSYADGKFDPQPLAAPAEPGAPPRFGDFNNDSLTDVFDDSCVSGQYYRLGPLQDLGNFPPGLGPILMDVNGDRRADLVFNSTQQSTGNDANLVTVFLAQADGTFQRQPQQTLGQASGWKDYFKNWLDVNGDGRTDLLWIINPTTNTNSVYVALAQSDGTFTLLPRQDFGAGWSGFGWSVGDLNGDGYGDFARFARQQEANNTYTALTATFLGSAAGTFTRVKDFQQFTVDAAFPTSGYLVDVNGDGRDDLLWNKKTTSNINLAVFLAGDDGLFTRLNSQTFAILPTPASTRVWFEDVNGDDRADLLILGSLGNSLKTAIYTANASGVFAPLKEASYLFGFNASFSQVMALNGDHKIDMLAFSSTTQSPPLPFKGENLIYPLFGTGNGNFTPQPMQYIPMQMWSILPFLTQGDVSGDGILDLIWYSSSNNHFMVTVGVLQTGHQLHLPLTQRRR